MRNWRNKSELVAIVLVTAVAAALSLSHGAFAITSVVLPPPAPEIDPSMAIAGLGVAGGAAALIWESLRRRK